MSFVGKTYNKEESLYYAKTTFDKAIAHPSHIKFRSKYQESRRFYDGKDVFLQQDLEKMKEMGIQGISANFIAPIVDNLTGIEVQSRYKSNIVIDTSSENGFYLSSALSSYLSNVDEENAAGNENAASLRDACIGGLGWINAFQHDNRTYIIRKHPLEVIPDFNDITPNFTDMEYVFAIHFFSEAEMRSRWKGKVEGINFSSIAWDYPLSPRLMNLNSTYLNESTVDGMSFVTEMQFKVPRKAFVGTTKEGRYFETFNLKKAEEIVDKKSSLESIDAKEIRRILFCQNNVLEYSPLNPSYPNQKDFSYIPMVYKKDGDNVPYGMVENLKALQLDSNARLTKMIRSYNAEKTFIKNAQFNTIEDIKKNKASWTDPSAVKALGQGEDVIFSRSTEIGDNQSKSLEAMLNLIKRTSGMEDESFGIQTNATSGRAQQARDAKSLRTNAFLFDNFKLFKERQATHLIKMLQHSFLTNIFVRVRGQDAQDAEELEPLKLNLSYEDEFGRERFENDINFIPFFIEIDETPNFKTSLDAQRAALENIANSPFGDIILMSEELLKFYTDKPKKIKQEVMNARKELVMLQNPQAFQQQGQPQNPQQQPLPEDMMNAA
jgi:hypothetical protein